MIKKLVFSVIYILVFTCSAFADPLQEGLDALQAGDPKAAYALWLPLANKGEAIAQFNIGLLYYNGEGVEQNFEQALLWLNKAAKQGDAPAINSIGWMHLVGDGVEVNHPYATKLFTKAANKGDVNAINNLGAVYARGLGTAVNYAKAFYWYSKSAKLNDPNGLVTIAKMYTNGHGVPKKDLKKSFEYAQKAANLGHAEAQYLLWYHYENSIGTTKSFDNALFWLKASAEQGYAPAQYMLGVCYLGDQGTPCEQIKDEPKAFALLKDSAKQGTPEAFFVLASLYELGSQFTEKNIPQAYVYLLVAKNQNYTPAITKQISLQTQISADQENKAHLLAMRWQTGQDLTILDIEKPSF